MTMKRNAKHIRTVAFALLLVAWAGCNSPSMQEFNDQIAQSNKRLATETWAFRATVSPLSEGKPVKVDKDGAASEVRAAHDKLRRLVKEIQEERKKVKVPKAPAAEELHKAYDQYLKSVERIVTEQFSQIVQLAENRAMQPADKWSKIQAITSAIQKSENDDLQKLRSAQTKFAEAVSMNLVQTY
jgi:ribosome-binding protein aMBF1 (putative translation factor)